MTRMACATLPFKIVAAGFLALRFLFPARALCPRDNRRLPRDEGGRERRLRIAPPAVQRAVGGKGIAKPKLPPAEAPERAVAQVAAGRKAAAAPRKTRARRRQSRSNGHRGHRHPGRAAARIHVTLELGAPAPAFALPDPAARTYTLSDFSASPALLVVFICNHCP